MNPDEAKKVVDEFDQMKKTRTFKDHDVGAKLHLVAALILCRLGPEYRAEAAQKCKEGLDFGPHDPSVLSFLQQLKQYLDGEPSKPGQAHAFPVGSGTGFCVAQGNYVLTNHHVIAGAKEIKIHLNGQQERYPAELVAGDEASDMALLKVEFPAGRKLVPIPLAATGVKMGEGVCVMGWPGRVMSANDELTQTQGAVSSFLGHGDDRMIVTDCKVDHGNSGGPLCSVGGIVGMVSQMTNDDNRYGLAIPVDRLRTFLLENLPPDGRKLPPRLPKRRTSN